MPRRRSLRLPTLALLCACLLVLGAGTKGTCDPEPEECLPTCADRACGGDGCGGSCGSCDDGDACTADVCDETDGRCAHVPIACDDGDPCTTDTCDTAIGCRHEQRTCSTPPSNVCLDREQLRTYSAAGACIPQVGICLYGVAVERCDVVCQVGRCVEGFRLEGAALTVRGATGLESESFDAALVVDAVSHGERLTSETFSADMGVAP